MTRSWSAAPSFGGDCTAHGHAETIMPTPGRDLPSASRQGLVRKLMAALSWLRTATPEPRERPLARIRTRHAALGFPYRRNPVASPVKPDRDCDCVPGGEW